MKMTLIEVNAFREMAGLRAITEMERQEMLDVQQPSQEMSTEPEMGTEELAPKCDVCGIIQAVKQKCEAGSCDFQEGDEKVVYDFINLLAQREGLEFAEAADIVEDSLYADEEEGSEEDLAPTAPGPIPSPAEASSLKM